MIKMIKEYFPPQKWKLPVSIVSGMLVGFLFLTIYLSRAGSYLSDDPAVCVNCHVMAPHYSTWFHSSHREIATCNDCHVPQDNIVRSYYFKAMDGMRHSRMFIFRQEPQIMQIKEDGIFAVQSNCLRCHIQNVHPVSLANVDGENYQHGEGKLCWDCHRHVPHGTVRSEAATPHSYFPKLNPIIPNWIKEDKIIRSINYESKK
jgi:cytochrome c nitrite reductase small subunit